MRRRHSSRKGLGAVSAADATTRLAESQSQGGVYFIAEIEIIDVEEYNSYATRAPETVAHYGGRYLVRGGKVRRLEGEAPQRVVVSVWKSAADLERWYNSPEYQTIIDIRHRAARSRAFIVEGLTS
jgi:uncharacterized protein (DUF1330 family)